MTAKTIVIEWLKANKCDGLCTYGCGCSLDDLIPCENGGMECVPGYFQHHTKENPDPEVGCDGTNCHCVGAVPPAISSGVGGEKEGCDNCAKADCPAVLVARREAIEECAKVVREKCLPCEGTGNSGDGEEEQHECEYCGRPIRAIRSLLHPSPVPSAKEEVK